MRPLLSTLAAAAALAVVSFSGPAVLAGDIALPVEEHQLDNGLTLLIHEDHDIPNAVVYVTWRVGSRNEQVGVTGLAHFFEHMMFRGGARYGQSFDPVMEAAGGSNNAYTTNDVTVYQDWFAKGALELIIDMESDRMSGMVFDPDGVAKEREVVASEWRNNMEEPQEVMSEQLWASAFTAHPYHWSVLGWKVDIDNWKKRDLEEFFARNYAPNNATMVVAGDVDPAQVLKLVTEKIGPIPRKPERRPIHTQEPDQIGERRVEVENTAGGLPRVMMAWHICKTSDPEFAVQEVLEALLLHGESSRLYRLLIEDEKVCLEVGGGWQGYQFDPSLFTVDCTVRDGRTPAEVEELVYAELARLAKDGPGERELRKVKNSLTADFVRRMRTIDGKASLISETETFFGGWRNLGARVKAIEAVTADDVKAVLAKRFTRTNRTVCTLPAAVEDDGQDAGDGERAGEDGR